MAIILDGTTLSGSMLWEDRDNFSPVDQTVRRTVGGGLVVFNRSLVKGRPITLSAKEDTGWITYAMLTALQVKAADASGVYSLNIHGFTASVVFRHSEPPALSFSPLTPKASYGDSDYFIGTLKLLTV